MTAYDFSPLFRSTIGFDKLFELAESVAKTEQAGAAYPPYDILIMGENRYRITMAVAGFGEGDLDIEVRENTLTIAGKRRHGDDDVTYLHRGIATRDFVRKFELADHMEVTAANLNNGVLSVDLVREIPEAMKPRHIDIKAGKPADLVGKAKKAIEAATRKSA